MQTNIAFARICLLYDLIVLVPEIQPFEKPSDLDRPNACGHRVLWNRVKKLIKDREIGALEFIVGSFEGWDQMEMGTHLLDMMRYILDDEPVSWVMGQVRCTGAKRSYGHVMEVHSACYFAFKKWG
jgi:hypothetical protein